MMTLTELISDYEDNFIITLENKAKFIVRNVANSDNAPERNIERSIALLLWEIDRQKQIRNKFISELRDAEFYTYQDLKRAKIETQYRDFNPSIDKLKDRLVHIDRERRSIEIQNHEAITHLLERLLALVNQHSQVIITYEEGR